MRVKVNRDVCPAQLAFCERCFGKFLLHPMGYERRCFEILEDDQSDMLTVDLHSQGHDQTIKLDDEQRALVAREGWAGFVDFDVPLYRNTPQA